MTQLTWAWFYIPEQASRLDKSTIERIKAKMYFAWKTIRSTTLFAIVKNIVFNKRYNSSV